MDDASRKAFEKWQTTDEALKACAQDGLYAIWQACDTAWRKRLQAKNLTDQELRLHFGELTTQSIRDVRAALNFSDAKWRERLQSEAMVEAAAKEMSDHEWDAGILDAKPTGMRTTLRERQVTKARAVLAAILEGENGK